MNQVSTVKAALCPSSSSAARRLLAGFGEQQRLAAAFSQLGVGVLWKLRDAELEGSPLTNMSLPNIKVSLLGGSRGLCAVHAACSPFTQHVFLIQ